jgi:hypothetical protein
MAFFIIIIHPHQQQHDCPPLGHPDARVCEPVCVFTHVRLAQPGAASAHCQSVHKVAHWEHSLKSQCMQGPTIWGCQNSSADVNRLCTAGRGRACTSDVTFVSAVKRQRCTRCDSCACSQASLLAVFPPAALPFTIHRPCVTAVLQPENIPAVILLYELCRAALMCCQYSVWKTQLSGVCVCSCCIEFCIAGSLRTVPRTMTDRH